MHHTVQMVTLVRKEFIQPFPVETFHRPPDALFEGFRIFPRRGKCWTYLGKSPQEVPTLNLAVEMVVWRYNFVIGKIKLSMLKRCRGEVVWTNSMTWIWHSNFSFTTRFTLLWLWCSWKGRLVGLQRWCRAQRKFWQGIWREVDNKSLQSSSINDPTQILKDSNQRILKVHLLPEWP